MEVQCIKPQTRDQSNKIRISKDYKWSIELTTSSKVGLLHSHQTNHIKHASTKFQTFEECFLNQFCHLSRKDATFSYTPIESQISRKLHSTKHEKTRGEAKDAPQFPHSIDSRHMQHQLTRGSPLNKVIDCKNLELLPIKKNNAFLGPFTFQMLFHGKEAVRQPKI